MKQRTWKGKPTAKSMLFAMWESGYDDLDWVLMDEFGITYPTIKSYRVEWARILYGGLHGANPVATVREVDLPIETMRGIVWHVWRRGDNTRLNCEHCPIVSECGEMVPAGGYLGCEKVLVKEMCTCDALVPGPNGAAQSIPWGLAMGRVAIARVRSRTDSTGKTSRPVRPQLSWPTREDFGLGD